MRYKEHAHMPVRSGALTLLIAVVAVCLAVLAVLAFSTARADLALAERAMELDAECENEAWRWLAQVDTALAEGASLPGGLAADEQGVLETVIEGEEGRRLTVRLVLAEDGGWRIDSWQLSQEWQADESLDLWDGSF